MVDGVVKEQNLRRFNDNGCQRQKPCCHNAFHARAQYAISSQHHGADADKSEHRQNTA